jgi:putative ABC transport system ATP-binding protein
MSAETILEVQQVSKIYRSAGKELLVLKEINFSIQQGSTVAITGPSGSGKTTLLGICAGLDQASSGSVALNNIKLDGLTEDERAAVRNLYVGFIFQNFQLMPTLTALENVMVPMELRKQKDVKARAMELLDKVGLADRSQHYPVQLPSSCRVASSSGCRWQGLFPTVRRYFLPMNLRETWMVKREKR